MIDENSLTYLEQYEASRGDQDPAQQQMRLDHAREDLAAVLRDLAHPSVPIQKEDASTLDRDGDTAMDGGEEVVTIPITIEDELADIPAEMRETVAKEIQAFRDRSNRRDQERLRKEEEFEAAERAKNGETRYNRLASPPTSTPAGPAGGSNGVPLGPRGAPAGPKGFGHQIPRDYQKGVSFINGNGINGAAEDEDSDLDDEELEAKRREKREAELEKQYLDQERRWLNRERSRTAAIEREKKRELADEERREADKEEMAERLNNWNDEEEASRKKEEYYADRSQWIRNRNAYRSREITTDDADRLEETREQAASNQKREQARDMADDFLNRQAAELESRNAAASAPREPARFKLSLGAAAQRAQAASTKRTVADVEGLLEDEEESSANTKRTLIPIKFDSAAEASGLTDEERKEAVRQLATSIPTDKEGLWSWNVKWEFVDEGIVSEQLKPFVEKKIMEYLGVQEQMLVEVVEEHIRKRGPPQELVEELEGVSCTVLYCVRRFANWCLGS